MKQIVVSLALIVMACILLSTVFFLPDNDWKQILMATIWIIASFVEACSRCWVVVPGNGPPEKIMVIGSILGGLTGFPAIYWLYQKYHRRDPGSRMDEIAGNIDTKMNKISGTVEELKMIASELRNQKLSSSDARE